MKVVLKIFPQKSHYNATFPLARHLANLGHEVIYAGVPALKHHVQAQGFAFYEDPADVFPFIENRQEPTDASGNMVRKTWQHFRMSRQLRKAFINFDAFAGILNALQPDHLLIDSPYTLFALALYKRKIEFSMIESMANLNRAKGCPPLDTTYCPTGTWLSDIVCDLHWRRYLLKRALRGFIGVPVTYNRRFVRKVAQNHGVDPSVISFDKYFHLGLRNVPEIMLSPACLDFPRRLAPNQKYFNPSEKSERVEAVSDFRFERLFARMRAERKEGKQLVYCSLGTAGWRYKGAKQFLLRVAEAAREQNWNIIIAIGTEFSIDTFNTVTRNVAVFQIVPQLKVLGSSDLMITHGGMNSISECIRYNVPMIVCPGTKDIDQAGNAARVAYAKLGSIASLQIKTEELASLVSESLAARNHRAGAHSQEPTPGPRSRTIGNCKSPELGSIELLKSA